jgi:apolipoprotein N-acyltransferase
VKRFSLLLTALAGSILLWASWPVSPFTLLIFIGWVPLLWVEDHATGRWQFFSIALLHMLVWNVLTTWWVWNASPAGAMGAFIANAIVMTIPWMLMRSVKKRWGAKLGYFSLVAFWLAFEFLHQNWDLSWPWLTLGNGFATHPQWVQWYEYTGASGGTLWILTGNILAYTAFKRYREEGRTRAYFISISSWIILLLLPMIISRFIMSSEAKKASAALAEASKNVVVVQPNIDPYKEKFAGDIDAQIQKLIVLSEQQIDQRTTLVVWPETAIPAQVWEDGIKENYFYNPIWSFLQRHPQVNLLTGIDSYKNYGTDKKNATATSRFESNSKTYYDAFNTAAFFDADTSIQLYHKAKLVPGVETLPSFLSFMGKWFEDFGGISGTLGRDSERKVFIPWDEHFKAAPIICYESIYGDYITEYVRKGANILTIITNDGWWGDTPGYKQHMNYGRLRALETRKWIARSANTGISCFIDPIGNVISPQPWDEPAAIKLNIPVDNRLTFFVKYGDLLSRAAAIISGIILVGLIISLVAGKLRKKARTGKSVR